MSTGSPSKFNGDRDILISSRSGWTGNWGPVNDVDGEQGYDNLNGRGGDDFMKGNSGNDDLGTGSGSNWLNGLDDQDTLIGNATTSLNNVLSGDAGDDFIDARNGDDDAFIDGAAGEDTCLVDNADLAAGVVYRCEHINP